MAHHQKGYIIIMTMLIIALGVAIVTYIYKKGTLYNPLAQLAAHKEKARMLTMSGLQIALAQLGEPSKNNTDDKNEQKKNTYLKQETQSETALLYQTLLPRLNRWQNFVLKENVDGVDATIRIAIGCEEGKINLNQIYDFTKKEFRKLPDGISDWSLILKELCVILEKQTENKELFEALKNFLHNRTQPLNDITELLLIKEFSKFKEAIFYQPLDTKTGKEHNGLLYLADIFTLYTQTHMIDPWVLSDSMCGILKFPRAEQNDLENRIKIIEPILKKFKNTYTWNSDWQHFLQPIYQKELQSLPKGIESVLQEKPDPTIFSVLISATYGKVTQKLYGIIERVKKKSSEQTGYTVEVRKIYTL